MTESKKHHYVPQSLLKNFSIDDQRKKIYTFRKIDYKVIVQAIIDAGSENYFNKLRDENLNFEPLFDESDSNLALIISRIINSNSINFIKKDFSNYEKLLECVAVQYLRVKIWRKTMQSIVKQENNIIDKHLSHLHVEKKCEISAEDAKLATLLSLESKEEIIEILKTKEFVLFESTPDTFFTISDNPIALLNRLPYSSDNIATMETEIYFPISPKLSLAFFSRGLLEMYKDKTPSFRIDNFCKSCDAIEVSRPQVRAMNFAQISNSCDYIYSKFNDFNFEKYMIEQQPCLKQKDSNVIFGEMGKGPIVSKGMPQGYNLVLYGQMKSHLIQIEMLQKDIHLQFKTEQITELQRAIADAPFIKGIVYHYNVTIKEMQKPYFIKSVQNGDEYYEMGYDHDHESIDQFMVELTKNKDISKEEAERLANKFLPKN